ncbi:hypothetical protein HYU23_02375 [Candidatus Woesearchaeota archaeon]|nr:hypothetical protein [Candidatus Woesearchaeota archaeon]
MPFTPFHLGIALLIWVLFDKYLDISSILLGSVILDVWPFLVLVLGLNYHLHGFSHSFLVALLAGLLFALFRFSIKSHFKLKKSFFATIISAVIGTFSHVLLDAPLYNDMIPFWPSIWNPFSGLYTYNFSVIFSLGCFIVAFILIFFKFFNRKHY